MREVVEQTGHPVAMSEAEEKARLDLIDQIGREAVLIGAPPYPNLRERAAAVKDSLVYSLFFRLYSQGGVHPFRMSLLPLLEDVPDQNAVLVRAMPKAAPVDDPYYLCAVLLIVTLDRLRSAEPGLALPSFKPLKSRLMELKSAYDEEGRT